METRNSQAMLVVRSMKSKIADAIKESLQGVNQLRTVDFDRVRLSAGDFSEVEMPAVQFLDGPEKIRHKQNEAEKLWSAALEVVIKSTTDRAVTRKDLWDLVYQIERHLWARPNFGIPGVLHIEYDENQCDLHLLDPYYVARIDFIVKYYEPLVRPC